jgi:hypothetical protein
VFNKFPVWSAYEKTKVSFPIPLAYKCVSSSFVYEEIIVSIPAVMRVVKLALSIIFGKIK